MPAQADGEWEEMIECPPGSEDLQQGDIIYNEAEFISPKSISHFVIVSQTCDLVRRNRSQHGSDPTETPRFQHAMTAGCVPAKQKLRELYPRKDVSNIIDGQRTQRIFKWNHPFLAFLPPAHDEETGETHMEDGLILTLETIWPMSLFKINSEDEVSVDRYEQALRNRVATVKSPWREKLGEMTGALFSRVATNDPVQEEIAALVGELFE